GHPALPTSATVRGAAPATPGRPTPPAGERPPSGEGGGAAHHRAQEVAGAPAAEAADLLRVAARDGARQLRQARLSQRLQSGRGSSGAAARLTELDDERVGGAEVAQLSERDDGRLADVDVRMPHRVDE